MVEIETVLITIGGNLISVLVGWLMHRCENSRFNQELRALFTADPNNNNSTQHTPVEMSREPHIPTPS
jgi:hypothetical protein